MKPWSEGEGINESGDSPEGCLNRKIVSSITSRNDWLVDTAPSVKRSVICTTFVPNDTFMTSNYMYSVFTLLDGSSFDSSTGSEGCREPNLVFTISFPPSYMSCTEDTIFDGL